MEPSDHIQTWMLAVAAFNEGDLEPLADRLAENCDWADVGSSRDEIMQALRSERDRGGVWDDVLSIATEDGAMVGIARNTMADGTSWLDPAASRWTLTDGSKSCATSTICDLATPRRRKPDRVSRQSAGRPSPAAGSHLGGGSWWPPRLRGPARETDR